VISITGQHQFLAAIGNESPRRINQITSWC
jgi:hypothetical protein